MLYPQQWMTYSMEERRILAEKLNIPRSGGMHVFNNKIISDGYTAEDLFHVTIEKLQEVTGSESNDILQLIQELLYPPIKPSHFESEDIGDINPAEYREMKKKLKTK